MKNFTGKKAVVTGGGHGIGRAIALALGGQGMAVAVADIEEDSASAVSAEVKALGVESIAVQTDVTDQVSLAALATTVEEQFGELHFLSNNAGVVREVVLAEASHEDWQWVMGVNLDGVVGATRALLPLMLSSKGQGRCHIVNTASMAGLSAVVGFGIGIYTASKYAVVGYSEMLRGELAPEGIDVSVLCPGMVRTDLPETSARNRPERFGGPMAKPSQEIPPVLAADMIEAEEVAQRVINGVRANRLYIFTHMGTRFMVEQRFEEIMADFDATQKEQ